MTNASHHSSHDHLSAPIDEPTLTTCTGLADPETDPDADPDSDVDLAVDDLEAPVAWDIEYPSWRADEILSGLYMGGTHDDATVADPMPLFGLGGPREVDAVVTLYAWAQPVEWEVEELRYGFGDGALHGNDLARVLRAAAWAYERWQAGDRVLIRCQAGLNRSGLVTALVLVMAGWEPADAIRHVRARRSPHALFNRHFVRWLVTEATDAVSAMARPDGSPSDSGRAA